MSTEVSEEHIVSIFRIRESANQEASNKQAVYRVLEMIYSSEISVDFYHTTLHYNPEIVLFAVSMVRTSNPTRPKIN